MGWGQPGCPTAMPLTRTGCPGAAVSGTTERSAPLTAHCSVGSASSRRPWLRLARLGLGRLPGACGRRSGARRCLCPQVCDSDTVLDPACTAEMLRILEADPRVGGVGGDVQVWRWDREGAHGAPLLHWWH